MENGEWEMDKGEWGMEMDKRDIGKWKDLGKDHTMQRWILSIPYSPFSISSIPPLAFVQAFAFNKLDHLIGQEKLNVFFLLQCLSNKSGRYFHFRSFGKCN